jgi:hypothetical protein
MKNRILFFAILAVFFAATEARPQSPPEITWLTPSTTQSQSLASFAVIRENANEKSTLDNIAAFTSNPPDAMGFIVPGLRPLSEMEGKQALAMAFTRNPAGRGYWNEKIPYDVINRELYLTLMRNRGKAELPTDEQVKQAIMEMTIGDAPPNFSSVYAVEMVDKATGAIKYGKREPYPGENFILYKGEPFISLTCLNFTPKQTTVVVTPSVATVPTTWDEYTLLSSGQQTGQTGLTVVNNNTNLRRES